MSGQARVHAFLTVFPLTSDLCYLGARKKQPSFGRFEAQIVKTIMFSGFDQNLTKFMKGGLISLPNLIKIEHFHKVWHGTARHGMARPSQPGKKTLQLHITLQPSL